MKSCKNKLILLLASVLTCATVFFFFFCTGNGGRTLDDIIDDYIVDEDYVGAGIDEPAWTAIPHEIELNGITYDIIVKYDYMEISREYEADELMGFWVNREDYQALYEKDPDAVYFINELNSISNGHINIKFGAYNIFEIYSVQGYDFEQYMGLGSDTYMMIVYVNNSYNGGD